MYATKDAPLLPRNGHTLLVGIGARISGCANQKEMSLDDQIDHGKEVAVDLYPGQIQGDGEAANAVHFLAKTPAPGYAKLSG